MPSKTIFKSIVGFLSFFDLIIILKSSAYEQSSIFLCKARVEQSLLYAMRNKMTDNGDPWAIPLSTGLGSAQSLPTRTEIFRPVIKLSTYFMILGPTFQAMSWCADRFYHMLFGNPRI